MSACGSRAGRRAALCGRITETDLSSLQLQSCSHLSLGDEITFRACEFDLDRWPSYTNLTCITWRWTCRHKMNFPDKPVESFCITCRNTDRQMPPKWQNDTKTTKTLKLIKGWLLQRKLLTWAVSVRIILIYEVSLLRTSLQHLLGLLLRMSSGVIR